MRPTLKSQYFRILNFSLIGRIQPFDLLPTLKTIQILKNQTQTYTMGENQQQAAQKEAPDFKDVEHGPITNSERQCRDVLCCVLFLINIIALVVFAIWGFAEGDPNDAYRATDNSRNICGQSGTATETFRFSYFFNPRSLDNRVCVKECPKYVDGSLQTLDCFNFDCTYDIVVNEDGSISSNYSDSDFVGYGSEESLDRICLPNTNVLEKAFKDESTALANGLSESYLADFVTDVENNWQFILAGFGFAVVVAFVMMFLMRFIAGVLVWVSVFGIILVFIGGGIVFLYNAGVIGGTDLGTLGIPTLEANDWYATYGYICFGFAGVLVLILLCCCSRLRLAVAVLKVAARFIVRVAQVMLVPILMTFLVLGLWAFSLAAMVYIISRATFVADGDIFTSLDSLTETTLGMFYYFVFGTLWTNALLGAITIFVIASCCCMWYFSQGPDSSLNSPVTTSYWRAFRFHFGSLAFGALILAIVQFIELVVEVIKGRTVDQTGNACARCAVSCLQCCLKCLERIVEYLNKQAYIQIALRGKNFCFASYDGICAILSNPLRYAIVSGVGSIIMFVTQLLISAGATALFYVLITFVDSIRHNVLEPILLLIVVFLGSYIIAIVFMSVYSVAMDTILACFIADEQNQNNRSGKPLYAPEELIDLMNK